MLDTKKKWMICGRCLGHAKVEHPAFDNGITSSEWAAWPDEERARYMRGAYDVECNDCAGLGRLLVPDVSQLTFAEKRVLVEERREARLNARLDRELAAEIAAERRMGC